jgi:hypothetical protein
MHRISNIKAVMRRCAAQPQAVEKQTKAAKCAFFASQWFAEWRGLV